MQSDVPTWDETEGHPIWGKKTFALAHRGLAKFDNIPYEDREEIIQEFAGKHPNMEGFGARSKFSTWLTSCLVKDAIDWLRVNRQIRIDPEKRRKYIPVSKPAEEGDKPTTHIEIADSRGHVDAEIIAKGMFSLCVPTPLLSEEEFRKTALHVAHCRDCQEIQEHFALVALSWAFGVFTGDAAEPQRPDLVDAISQVIGADLSQVVPPGVPVGDNGERKRPPLERRLRQNRNVWPHTIMELLGQQKK